MRFTKLLRIAIASIVLILYITGPSLAAAERGTGTLYVYTDPERTTLVDIDSNGRYCVVPGTEYYLKISSIEEYGNGEEITIWAFRVNTAEDITVENVAVGSDSNAVFTWTIPEAWLDEVVKIKYGSSLEHDWFYARGEIWVNTRVGNGVLYAYTDTERTEEAPIDEGGNYLVYPGAKYYFTITGITEYSVFSVWAFYTIGGTTINDPITNFEWDIPNLPVETSIKIKYGTSSTGSMPAWYFARRDVVSAPRLLLVVPGVFLGSIGAVTALFSVLGVKAFLSRKR